jgi:lipopolysaccharide transport system permease protein
MTRRPFKTKSTPVNPDLPVTVYTPESQLRTPGRLLHSMWHDLLAGRELAWRLFVRDISARYRQSALGIFWAFLPPIVTALVFIILQSKKIVNFGETNVPYPLFVFVGTMLWQIFVESLNGPLHSVTNAKSMLAKVHFPWESLLLSAFYSIVFNLLMKVSVLAGILIFFKVHLTWPLCIAPLAIFILILLGMTVGLFLTPLGILYSDIGSALGVVVPIWFFVTPVVYPAPETFPYSLMNILNPVSPILVGTRDLITQGALTNPGSFLMISALTISGLFMAWFFYRLAIPILIERMSA